MSKLERLNARVAKLLTEAVAEVLEVVKETVSEYKDKTARTQRENESLKRRLQELQEQIARGSTAAPITCNPLTEEKEIPQIQEEDACLALMQNAEPCLQEQKIEVGHKPDYEVKQESKQQENCDDIELQPECSLAQASEDFQAPSKELVHIVKEATTVNSSQSANMSANIVSSITTYTPLPETSLGVNLAVIKSEPEPSDSTASEQPPVQDQFSGCVDLSCNSSRFSPAELHRPQVSSESHRLVFAHSNHAIPRRHGFAKTNRTALDGRKIRMEHLRREEPHMCVVCGKSFSRVGNLRIHQRCHTGEKPYGCIQCGRRFSQAGDLKKHKRVHTGEKPYYCNHCGKSFSRGENLKRHQKIHIGEILQLQQVWREQQQ